MTFTVWLGSKKPEIYSRDYSIPGRSAATAWKHSITDPTNDRNLTTSEHQPSKQETEPTNRHRYRDREREAEIPEGYFANTQHLALQHGRRSIAARKLKKLVSSLPPNHLQQLCNFIRTKVTTSANS